MDRLACAARQMRLDLETSRKSKSRKSAPSVSSATQLSPQNRLELAQEGDCLLAHKPRSGPTQHIPTRKDHFGRFGLSDKSIACPKGYGDNHQARHAANNALGHGLPPRCTMSRKSDARSGISEGCARAIWRLAIGVQDLAIRIADLPLSIAAQPTNGCGSEACGLHPRPDLGGWFGP